MRPSIRSLVKQAYCAQPNIHEIFHIKCPIICLIRCQIAHANDRFTELDENWRKRHTWSYKLWKYRWMLISWLLMSILMVSLFVYGTVVGAGLCANGGWKHSSYNYPCPKRFSFPGVLGGQSISIV
nr:unnamed protein product [Callosobruchus chinensis]